MKPFFRKVVGYKAEPLRIVVSEGFSEVAADFNLLY